MMQKIREMRGGATVQTRLRAAMGYDDDDEERLLAEDWFPSTVPTVTSYFLIVFRPSYNTVRTMRYPPPQIWWEVERPLRVELPSLWAIDTLLYFWLKNTEY